MDTGTKISLAVHGALLFGLLVGNPFRSEPLPMNVQDVAVISEAEFARLQTAQQAPDAVTEIPVPESLPEEPEPPRAPVPETPAAQPPDTPEVAAAPQVEDVPVVPQIAPDADVEDTPPEVSQPSEDVAVLVPETAPEAVPQQADRVAPEPVAPPAPEAAPDPETREAIAPDDAATQEAPVEEPQEATAPEAAAPELVTEADRPAAAPAASLRPRTRPARAPQQAEAPAPAPASETPRTEGPVETAAPAPSENIPLGPPLTGGERDGLRVAVSSCWNVGALSTEAQETRVTVYVAMNRDGTPQTETIRMLSSEGGSAAAARRVFDTARRAIIRCGARGFPLPVEKYGQWREIEMTFNPEGIFWR